MAQQRKPPRSARRRALWLVAALSLTLTAPMLVAQEDPSNDGISLNLVDADVAFVLRALMDGSKANIVLEGGISGQVTCQLDKQPLERVLDFVCRAVSPQLYWHKEDGVYLVTRQPYRAPSAPSAPPAMVPQTSDPVGPPAQGPLVLGSDLAPRSMADQQPAKQQRTIARIPLRFLDPRLFTYQAGQAVDPTLEMMRAQTSASPFAGFQPLNNGYGNGAGRTPGSESGNDLMQRLAGAGLSQPAAGGFSGGYGSPAGGSQQFPGGFGQGGGYGQGGGFGQGGMGQGGFGQGGMGQGGGTNLGTVLDLIMQIPGITSIVPYYPDNSLLVLGTEEAIAELRKLIEMLDRPPKQVRIEAQFLQVSMGDAEKFGFNWMISDGSTEVGADLSSSGDLNVRFARGSFAAQLQAFKSTHRGQTIIAPRVTTQNNVPAVVQMGHTSVFFTPGSSGGGPFGAPPSPPQPQQYQVQIQLPVLPRINGDNSVTLFTQPTVQDISGTVSNPAGGTIPIIETQSVQIPSIRVKDGETLVLGGLVRRSTSHDSRRLPFIGQLPLIGNLFRNSDKSNDDSELLIFITPTVLPGEEEVEGLASGTAVQAVPVGGAAPAAPAPAAPGPAAPALPALPGIGG